MHITRPATLKRRALALALLASTALGAVELLPTHAQALAPAAAASHAQGFADLVEQVSPAVVRISMMEAAPRMPREFRGTPLEKLVPGDRLTRAQPQQDRVVGQGSGFIIDPAGYIVTNYHVAGKADQLKVTLPDGTELPAKLVGGDERTDLALLKVEAPKPLPAVEFATGTPPRVGDVVIAVGNPFGLSASVTAGIISARGRDLGAGLYDDFLQTDAAINPGNSGGPLFDADGQVVGVNTAIVSPSGGSVGIGFAIPAQLASKVVSELRSHGVVQRGWLGVELGPNEDGEKAGARVLAVQRQSPADRAGLRPGDVILEADGGSVADGRSLARQVADHAPGSALKLAVRRNAATLDMQVKLGDLPRES
ncbi:PDZ domain-containing protein [Pseudoroseomonas wenyumeiae]|uniref:PDZ domain-containing protein n=1 Tax=Teichococcus wenyumeiae TaxID=2478470 RepID=A0A3A9JFN9_9PROT|nr:trypsin-like peptidase domain-containing protein [Pseudoroseomonas wenyumeiae]RKK02456.1 PDZ domain-containing protein [Pseudoroseomonas wenyumeiae]RMI26130.1 PDZ domain-containing protein [Pseudoroseomonas wenyumeiae]